MSAGILPALMSAGIDERRHLAGPQEK